MLHAHSNVYVTRYFE